MDADRETLRPLDGAIWIIIAAGAIADLASTWAGWFQISWISLLKPLLACGALAAAGWFYRAVRKDPRLAAALTGTAQIVAFAAVGAPLSYIAARMGFPLQDATLAGWDRALGLDWGQWLAFVTAHPWLRLILLYAYSTFLLQTLGVVLILSFSGQIVRLRAFVCTFIATALITIGISMICPAQGAWSHYGIDVAAQGYLPLSHTSWPVFLGLRDGSVNVLTGFGSEGIITFPSLHTALGVVFAIALWKSSILRWIAVTLNVAMIAGTPIEGSHYFADVIAGAVIAVVCWVVIMRAMTRSRVATRNSVPESVQGIESPALAPATFESKSPNVETVRALGDAAVIHEV
jgi:membrane-associated phospholipid phosphatase